MRQKKAVEMRKVLSNQCDKMLETMLKFKSPKNNNNQTANHNIDYFHETPESCLEITSKEQQKSKSTPIRMNFPKDIEELEVSNINSSEVRSPESKKTVEKSIFKQGKKSIKIGLKIDGKICEDLKQIKNEKPHFDQSYEFQQVGPNQIHLYLLECLKWAENGFLKGALLEFDKSSELIEIIVSHLKSFKSDVNDSYLKTLIAMPTESIKDSMTVLNKLNKSFSYCFSIVNTMDRTKKNFEECDIVLTSFENLSRIKVIILLFYKICLINFIQNFKSDSCRAYICILA